MEGQRHLADGCTDVTSMMGKEGGGEAMSVRWNVDCDKTRFVTVYDHLDVAER